MNRNCQVNKDLVIEFLNMVLNDVEIVDVDLIPNGHMRLSGGSHKVVFDFKCQCRDGDSILIKFQVAASLIDSRRHLAREDYFKGRSSEWDISRLEWE